MNSKELQVPAHFRRSAAFEEEVAGAVWLIGHMCEHVGLAGLGDTEVLDFGCGVRFTEALLNHSLPIKRYVGVDVYREMIEFLNANVDDPRFEFIYLNAHNELYNPNGEPLSEHMSLPIAGQQFDLICLFSVFTHLAPHDYRAMLKLLRRFVKPTGRLFFTLFINELTPSGLSARDQLYKWSRTNPTLEEAIRRRLASGDSEPADFKDFDRGRPLQMAVYSRKHAFELIDGTGWEVLTLSPPDMYVQHHFLCAPSTETSSVSRGIL